MLGTPLTENNRLTDRDFLPKVGFMGPNGAKNDEKSVKTSFLGSESDSPSYNHGERWYS